MTTLPFRHVKSELLRRGRPSHLMYHEKAAWCKQSEAQFHGMSVRLACASTSGAGVHGGHFLAVPATEGTHVHRYECRRCPWWTFSCRTCRWRGPTCESCSAGGCRRRTWRCAATMLPPAWRGATPSWTSWFPRRGPAAHHCSTASGRCTLL